MNMPVKSRELHASCEMVIRWQTFKGRNEPTPGLYCRNHGNLVQWLNVDIARELIAHGVQEEK